MWAIWRNLLTGTFVLQKVHWGSAVIYNSGMTGIRLLGRLLAPSASLSLQFSISARSSLSSPCWSKRTVQEKVHAFPFARKQLSFPWLRRILSVSLGSFLSWVSSMYISCIRIWPWIFSHSNTAAPIFFSTFVSWPISPGHSLGSAVSKIPCQVLLQNLKKVPCCSQEQEQVVNTAPSPLLELCFHKFSLLASC